MTTISPSNAVGFTSELAALLLQNEANQAESAHLQRDAARESFLRDAQSQVSELNAAAKATLTSALVSAGFSMVGSACAISGAVSQFKADTTSAGLDPKDFSCSAVDLRRIVAGEQKTAKIWNAIGATSTALAESTTMIGQSIAGHDQAAAKRSELASAQAQWEASDASSAIDKATKQSDTILDTLQGIQRDQNASNNAIIGRI